MKRLIATCIALVVVTGAAGCASRPATPESIATVPVEEVPDAPMLTTTYPRTVADRDGAELCVVGVLQSNPPGCAGGVTLIGWDWAEVPAGTYEEMRGVRWGDYVVTGAYDAQRNQLTVTSVSTEVEPPRADDSPMGPPIPAACSEPPEGWRIVDESKANQEALYAVSGVARMLDGYATMWIDRTPLPPAPDGADALDQMHHYAVNAGLNIVTVAVQDDAVAAERRIREVWGGALCVITVDYTDAERQAVLEEIMDEYAERGVIVSGLVGVTGVIDVTVVYDLDYALQRELDERYGAGLVIVSSALAPV